MLLLDLQTAMHAKGRHRGLKCHTRKRKGDKNSLQVQFYKPVEE